MPEYQNFDVAITVYDNPKLRSAVSITGNRISQDPNWPESLMRGVRELLDTMTQMYGKELVRKGLEGLL